MAAGRDAGRTVHVAADVALLGQERRTRVQANPHSDRAQGEALGEGRSRCDRARSRREGEEKGVSLGVDLDPAFSSACRPDHAAALGEGLCVGLGAQLVQQPGRALHVGEEEGDRAGREVVSHAAVIICPAGASVQSFSGSGDTITCCPSVQECLLKGSALSVGAGTYRLIDRTGGPALRPR